MAWDFRVYCPDCHHEWEGMAISFCLGPSSALKQGNTQIFFCPRCYYRLRLPHTLDRNSWWRWYKEFLAGKDAQIPFFRRITGIIDASLSLRPWYRPIEVQVGAVDCPECKLPMDASSDSDSGDHLVCPECGSHSPLLAEYESHSIIIRTPNGWS